MMRHIIFTPLEAELVRQRLSFLATATERQLQPLFAKEGVDVDYLQSFCAVTSRNLIDGILMVPLANEEAIVAMVNSIERTATLERVNLDVNAGRISPQKGAAYRKALKSAVEKIEIATCRSLASHV
jgi:hypothetical protein